MTQPAREEARHALALPDRPLAPLLWGQGVGAEVLRAMVVPVLGGIPSADEVIDLFLPVLFDHVRRRRWQRLHTGWETA